MAAATATGKMSCRALPPCSTSSRCRKSSRVLSADTFKRPIYAGNAIQTVQATEAKTVITVRTASFAAAAEGGSAAVEAISGVANPGLSSHVRDALSSSDRPELTSAKIIISGGRALGSSEKFTEVILPVADKLGAASAQAVRPSMRAMPPTTGRFGQTGKVVAPDLYIACGISGAIQHLAGMKDSKVIVAINKDEEAPIFQVADYGLVADCSRRCPSLKSAVTRRVPKPHSAAVGTASCHFAVAK